MSINQLSFQSFIYSILLHIIAVVTMFGGIDITHKPITAKKVDIVKAVAVDNKQIESELQRLQEIEKEKEQAQKKKQQELEKKLRDIKNKTSQAEKQRKQEEKKLAELKRKKEAEKKKKELEQRKLAELKKQQEELVQKRKLEEQEKQRRDEEEKKRVEAEQALKEQLAEEQRILEQARRDKDQEILQSTVAKVYTRVVNNFNKSGLPDGLECILIVRLIPGGDVISVSINQSSGNDIFDHRAILAIEKASPLPVPQDIATFERLNLRQFSFRFRPEN